MTKIKKKKEYLSDNVLKTTAKKLDPFEVINCKSAEYQQYLFNVAKNNLFLHQSLKKSYYTQYSIRLRALDINAFFIDCKSLF